MADIFLSYAREDRASAERIAQALAGRGYDVWWDPDIPAGPSYTQVIDQALTSAKCVLVLWSAASVASSWVQDEAREGQERGLLVSARLADVKPPLGFRGHQLADLAAWDGGADDREFRRLLRGIEAHVPALPLEATAAGDNPKPAKSPSASATSVLRAVAVHFGGLNRLAIAAVVAVVVVSGMMVILREERPGPASSDAAAPSDSAPLAAPPDTGSRPPAEPTTSAAPSRASVTSPAPRETERTAAVPLRPPETAREPGRERPRDDRTLLGYAPGNGVDVGAPGKDVVYVPTPPATVYEMLRLAGVGPNDTVYDLGSGDGRIVIMAARHFGARGVGIEYSSELNAIAAQNARAAGVADRVSFRTEDLFSADLSSATVIAMFLLPSINEKLAPTLQRLAPGTRIVTNTFSIEGWQPTKEITLNDCTNWCRALLYTVGRP